MAHWIWHWRWPWVTSQIISSVANLNAVFCTVGQSWKPDTGKQNQAWALHTDTVSPFPPLAPVFRLPVKALGINADSSFCWSFCVHIHRFFGDCQDVLSFIIVDEIQVLQGRYNIFLFNACQFGDLAVHKNNPTIELTGLHVNFQLLQFGCKTEPITKIYIMFVKNIPSHFLNNSCQKAAILAVMFCKILSEQDMSPVHYSHVTSRI